MTTEFEIAYGDPVQETINVTSCAGATPRGGTGTSFG